jgi:hypothetical protein
MDTEPGLMLFATKYKTAKMKKRRLLYTLLGILMLLSGLHLKAQQKTITGKCWMRKTTLWRG